MCAGLVTMAVGCTGHDSHPSQSARGTGSNSAPSTGTGAAQSSGSIHKTVPAKTVVTASPVATDQTATFGNRIAARISTIKKITAVARGAGEVSGPAVAVTFVIENGSGSSIDLGTVTANLQDAAGVPSVSMVASPAQPFAGTVGAGKSRTATYVFALAPSHRNPVTISLSYTTAAPVVLFVGTVH